MEEATKTVHYQSVNSYETLYQLTDTTKNVWITFHGMGYLSRYFLKPFRVLDEKENYLIAPQAPSKYYLDEMFRRVGANWLTREDTPREIENVLNYVDKVWEAENITNTKNVILFGFSQGVSIVTRWLARKRIPCQKLVLYAGGIPNELTPDDFKFLTAHATEVLLIYGDKDPYLNEERIAAEIKKADTLFGSSVQTILFKGGHHLQEELLQKIL
ncbi:MAG: esterase [Bacteroidota bacterium]